MAISAKALRMRGWHDQKMVESWEAEARQQARTRRPSSLAKGIWQHLRSVHEAPKPKPKKER